MADYYNAAQVEGKTLIAKKNLSVWKTPPRPDLDFKGEIWKNVTIKSGDSAGIVYSSIGGEAGRPLYWMFRTPESEAARLGKWYYIQHEPGAFDVKSLKEQGILTTKELQELKEESEKTFGDKLLEALKKGGKYILIAAVLFYGVKLYKEIKK